MEPDCAINELVEVTAAGIRIGHRGRLVNRFACIPPLYAVQFPDNCIGYFQKLELNRVAPEEARTERMPLFLKATMT